MSNEPVKPSHPSEVKSGYNEIVMRSIQYGLQPAIMEKDVPVKVRDGHTLYANVFRPKKEGRFPVVISADIYGKDSIHKVFADRLGGTLGGYECSLFCAWEAPDPGFWVPNEYVVVKLGLRGTCGSMGELKPLSLQEAEDYFDGIEWAAAQPWSSGKVGMNGVSYLAMCQWRVAQLNPPHLAAMIPWEGVNDLYREWSYHGGIPETQFSRLWIKLTVPRITPGAPLEDFNRLEAEHPLWDDFWQSRHGNLADIRVPMYVGASWSTQGLHNRGTLEGFRQASSKDKWLEVHGRKEWETYYSREVSERLRAFFDYFLKGIENDFRDRPRVRLEIRDSFYSGAFRHENQWPLARTRYSPLYLNASGSMDAAPVAQAATVSYDSTVALSTDSPAGRVMFSHRFAKDTELTGYMKLKLWVSTDAADDLDLFIGVHKLDRRGQEVYLADFNHTENGRVASGWLRVSHRELDPSRSTPYQPWLKHQRLLKLKPGEIVQVEVEIWPSSTLFRAGESVQVTVQGSEVPRAPLLALPAEHSVSRYAHRELVNCGQHIIHCGGQYDSHLLVPVIGE